MNKRDVRITFQLVGDAVKEGFALIMAKLSKKARLLGESKRGLKKKSLILRTILVNLSIRLK